MNGDDVRQSAPDELKDQLAEAAGTLRGIADSLEKIATSPGIPDASTFLYEVIGQLGAARYTASEDLRHACRFASDFYSLSARRIAEQAGVSNRTVSTWLNPGSADTSSTL